VTEISVLQISYEWSSTICPINLAWPAAFRAQAVVAPVFPFEAARSRLVGALHVMGRVVGAPIRSASKEGGDHLPLRWGRGRALHLADVR
jgi:hypothetical protein